MSFWAECNSTNGAIALLSPIIGFERFDTNPGFQSVSFDPSIPTRRREDASFFRDRFSSETLPSDCSHILDGDMLGDHEMANGFSYQAGHQPFANDGCDYSQFKSDLTDTQNENFSDTPLQPSNVVTPSTPELDPQEKLSFDVGLESLDDIIGAEDSNQYIGSPLLGSQSPFLEQSSSAAEVGPSQSVAQHWNIENCGVPLPSIKFRDLFELPSPKVLKTGFDIAKSVRGGSYDFTTHSPRRPIFDSQSYNTRWSGPRPGMRSQFNTSHRSSNYSSTSPTQDEAIMALNYKPSKFESNLYRTVSFSGLAPIIHLRDVLARIRGGAIKSAVMADTTAITGSKTAIVQFVMENAASAYVLHTSRCPIVFVDDVTGANISAPSISRVNTPTYVSSKHPHGGLDGYNQTRCISIEEFPEHIDASRLAAELSFRFQFRCDTLMEVYVGGDGILHLEFSSIESACIAYTTISIWSRDLCVRFETDPCSRSLEDLKYPVEKRPSITIADEVCTFMSPEEQATVSVDNPHKFNILLRWITSHGGCPIQLSSLAETKPAPRWMPSGANSVPRMNGSELRGPSWADEVMNELADDYSASNSEPALATNSPDNPISTSKGNTVADGIKKYIYQEDKVLLAGGKPPVGLAGSIYATTTPGFLNESVPHSTHLCDRDGKSSGIFYPTTALCQYRQQADEHSGRDSDADAYNDRLSLDKGMLSTGRYEEVPDEMAGDNPGNEPHSIRDKDNKTSLSGVQNSNSENREDEFTLHETSGSDTPSIGDDSQSCCTLVNSFASSSFPNSAISSSSTACSSSFSSSSSDPTSTLGSEPTAKIIPSFSATLRSRHNDSSISTLLLYNATIDHMHRHSPNNPFIPIRWLCPPLRKVLAKRAQEKPYILINPTTGTTNTTTAVITDTETETTSISPFIELTSLPDLDRGAARSHIVWTLSGGAIRRDIVQYFTRDGCVIGTDDLARLSAEETRAAGKFFAMREGGADFEGVLLKEGFWGESDSETEELS